MTDRSVEVVKELGPAIQKARIHLGLEYGIAVRHLKFQFLWDTGKMGKALSFQVTDHSSPLFRSTLSVKIKPNHGSITT